MNMKASHSHRVAKARRRWLRGGIEYELACLLDGLKLNGDESRKRMRRVPVKRAFQPRSLSEARKQRSSKPQNSSRPACSLSLKANVHIDAMQVELNTRCLYQ